MPWLADCHRRIAAGNAEQGRCGVLFSCASDNLSAKLDCCLKLFNKYSVVRQSFVTGALLIFRGGLCRNQGQDMSVNADIVQVSF